MLRDFLADHVVAALATVTDSGEPRSCTVFYAVSQEGNLVFKSRAGSEHMSNLRQHARAAMSVYDETSTYLSKRGVQLIGRVEQIETVEAMQEAIDLYSAALNGAAARFDSPEEMLRVDAKSKLYRFCIDEAKFTDSTTLLEPLEYSRWAE